MHGFWPLVIFCLLVGFVFMFDSLVLNLVQTLRSSPLYALIEGETLFLFSNVYFSVWLGCTSVREIFHALWYSFPCIGYLGFIRLNLLCDGLIVKLKFRSCPFACYLLLCKDLSFACVFSRKSLGFKAFKESFSFGCWLRDKFLGWILLFLLLARSQLGPISEFLS